MCKDLPRLLAVVKGMTNVGAGAADMQQLVDVKLEVGFSRDYEPNKTIHISTFKCEKITFYTY